MNHGCSSLKGSGSAMDSTKTTKTTKKKIMKTKDQTLLEEAYSQIFLAESQKHSLHKAFLIEAGLLDKAKQVAGNVVGKAKSMFASSVEKLLGIVQKADPELFKRIQQAVQQKDDKALQAIFNAPEVKQQQLQAESLFLGEGVSEFVSNAVNKAQMFMMKNPKLAATMALAGIMGAVTASGPDALNHLAGFLVQTGGKALAGAGVGAAIGGTVGGIRGGWEGAKQGAKTGAIAGAGIGLASGTQDVMAHGASNIDDLFSNVMASVSPDEAKALEALKAKIAKAGLDADSTKEIADVLRDKTASVEDKIELIGGMIYADNTDKEVKGLQDALGGFKETGQRAGDIAAKTAAQSNKDLEDLGARIDKSSAENAEFFKKQQAEHENKMKNWDKNQSDYLDAITKKYSKK